jgi:chemotaxis protein MotB
LRRLILLVAVTTLTVGMGGCTRAAYVNKANEAENLSMQLADVQQKHRALVSENEALKVRISKLITETAGATRERDGLAASLASTTADRDKLANDNKELRKTLQERTDSLSGKITDLNRKVAELANENDGLKRKIVQIQKGNEEKVANLMKTYEGWMAQMKPEIVRGEAKVTVSESEGSVSIHLVESVLFDPGQAELSPEGLAVLRKVIPGLRNAAGKAIRIEGHTDNLPIGDMFSKIYPTNWELSAARATNVTRYLEEQGVDPARLSAVAYGEHKPIADNGTPEGRAKNRRIEIILVPKE